MDEWLQTLAPHSVARYFPILWVGPTAAGHLKPTALAQKEGNGALWRYSMEMAKEAEERGMEVLGMWNATIQAESWDGSGYGVGVGLLQAMMVSLDVFSTSSLLWR